ncbi:MAG: hypothetical protein RL518_275 [Pseudomonadota bacterium]|jgi:TPR repeat protein
MSTFDKKFGNDGAVVSKADRSNDVEPNQGNTLGQTVKAPDFSQFDRKDVEAAAAGGNMAAQNELGNRYWNGTGEVHKDPELASKWWKEAATQGHDEALSKWVSLETKSERPDGSNWAIIQLILGDARYEPADLYALSVGVREQSGNPGHPLAIECLVRAANSRYAPAEYDLGKCYLFGIGIGQNPNDGLALLFDACNQGYAPAECLVGHFFGQGMFVQNDYTIAARLFTSAAHKGFAQAQFYLGGCYKVGQGVPQDSQLYAQWMDKAAQQGHPEAMFCLGVSYLDGVGVQKDEPKGWALVEAAAEKGDPYASLYIRLKPMADSGR